MEFTPVAPYLDPFNWHQQQNYQSGLGSNIENMHLQFPPPDQSSVGVSAIGCTKPGYMTDRSLLAKLPRPEASLKCPRCESTNTKFCYFNNYSLSQPRHFCKTCRRYWTRGGALRSVPVGGGCRRNTKSKACSSSKSQGTLEGSRSTSSTSTVPSSSFTTDAISPRQPTSQFPFMMNSLHHVSNYGGRDIGWNISPLQAPVAPTGSNAALTLISDEGTGHLKSPQNTLLAGLDPQTGLYTFGGGKSYASVIMQVKMEENQGANGSSSRQLVGIPGNDIY